MKIMKKRKFSLREAKKQLMNKELHLLIGGRLSEGLKRKVKKVSTSCFLAYLRETISNG